MVAAQSNFPHQKILIPYCWRIISGCWSCNKKFRNLMEGSWSVLCWRHDVMVPWWCYVDRCCVSGKRVRWHGGCEVRTFDLWLFTRFVILLWVATWFRWRVYGIYAEALSNIYARCVVIIHGHWLALMQCPWKLLGWLNLKWKFFGWFISEWKFLGWFVSEWKLLG